ncbi:hypothetical protein HGM15179_006838 [Zosterops borbonicus]|uniref:Uncharacterized protein n=1 Tax=Zosterops borbonicus TaxID=364589 RepID=A0A8K1LNQ8_9PASS|nr:hypothetical protein HGM15179_006838 [Zosterops borbonicus]
MYLVNHQISENQFLQQLQFQFQNTQLIQEGQERGDPSWVCNNSQELSPGDGVWDKADNEFLASPLDKCHTVMASFAPPDRYPEDGQILHFNYCQQKGDTK